MILSLLEQHVLYMIFTVLDVPLFACCYKLQFFYRSTLCISAAFILSSVRLFVRPPGTFVYCIQTAEDNVKLLSRHRSPIILVFLDHECRQSAPNSNGNPFSRGAKYEGWETLRFAIVD